MGYLSGVLWELWNGSITTLGCDICKSMISAKINQPLCTLSTTTQQVWHMYHIHLSHLMLPWCTFMHSSYKHRKTEPIKWIPDDKQWQKPYHGFLLHEIKAYRYMNDAIKFIVRNVNIRKNDEFHSFVIGNTTIQFFLKFSDIKIT